VPLPIGELAPVEDSSVSSSFPARNRHWNIPVTVMVFVRTARELTSSILIAIERPGSTKEALLDCELAVPLHTAPKVG
jgi:hypothetical protein